jgi:hypothetical protein
MNEDNKCMEKYLPRSFGMIHALVVRCRTMSFHRTSQQPRCRRKSLAAGLCHPLCRLA